MTETTRITAPGLVIGSVAGLNDLEAALAARAGRPGSPGEAGA